MTENGYPWRCLKRNSEFSANDSTPCSLCVCCESVYKERICDDAQPNYVGFGLNECVTSGALLETRVNIIKHQMHTKAHDMVRMNRTEKTIISHEMLGAHSQTHTHTHSVAPCCRKPTHADSFEIQQIPSKSKPYYRFEFAWILVCFSLNCTFGNFTNIWMTFGKVSWKSVLCGCLW